MALDQILRNFPSRRVSIILRGVIFPLGRRFRTPNDRLGRDVARLLLQPGESRDRLTDALYLNENPDDVTGCLEVALKLAIQADPISKDLKDRGFRKPYDQDYEAWLQTLVDSSDLTLEQSKLLIDSAAATHKVIMVDDFPGDFQQSGVVQKTMSAGYAEAS